MVSPLAKMSIFNDYHPLCKLAPWIWHIFALNSSLSNPYLLITGLDRSNEECRYTLRQDKTGTNLYASTTKSLDQLNAEEQVQVSESLNAFTNEFNDILAQLNSRKRSVDATPMMERFRSAFGASVNTTARNMRSLEWFKNSENRVLLNSLRNCLDHERHILNLYGITSL